MAGGGWPGVFAREPFGIRVGRGVLGRYFGRRRHILKEFIYVVQMRYQFQPKGHLGCPVVVSDSRLEANVEI